ncbi:MAG: hypothetical protein AAF468_10675 [Pseudomonadota bacterium]
MLRILFVVLIASATTFFASAAGHAADSLYSKLDFDKHCTFEKPASEEEEGMGASGVCRIPDFPEIHFAEGDLRHSAGFGAPKQFESFAQFNSMNNTIEWRFGSDGVAYAAIVRFFIENINPATGAVDPKRKGQVLVIHRVASGGDKNTCVVGMVDARANENANQLARDVADGDAAIFQCGVDKAKYHGRVGKFAGTPSF